MMMRVKMKKEEIIGKQFNLDLGSLSPVSMIVRDITKDKVIVEYLYSTPGRMEEFKISEFEELSMIKINQNKTKMMEDKIEVYVEDAEATDEQFIIREFTNVINRLSLENNSNTPDYVLAEYLYSCLESFNKATREKIKHNNQNNDE